MAVNTVNCVCFRSLAAWKVSDRNVKKQRGKSAGNSESENGRPPVFDPVCLSTSGVLPNRCAWNCMPVEISDLRLTPSRTSADRLGCKLQLCDSVWRSVSATQFIHDIFDSYFVSRDYGRVQTRLLCGCTTEVSQTTTYGMVPVRMSKPKNSDPLPSPCCVFAFLALQ